METEKKREVIVRYAHELDYSDHVFGEGKNVPFILDDPGDTRSMSVYSDYPIVYRFIVGDLSYWEDETLDEYLTHVDFPKMDEIKYKPTQPIYKIISVCNDGSEGLHRYFFDGTQPTKRILFSTSEEAIAHRKKNHPEEFDSPDD